MKPITPDEVSAEKCKHLPDFIIKCFNELITLRWNGESAIIPQNEILFKICEVGKVSREFVFNKKYLDIEPIFREAGWDVEYDAYNKTNDAMFIFRKKRK